LNTNAFVFVSCRAHSHDAVNSRNSRVNTHVIVFVSCRARHTHMAQAVPVSKRV
jgi:hypothetical protein